MIDDYDSPWKEALEIYFKEFMLFFFPEIAKKINWNKPHQFRDKEFQKIVRDASMGRRYADKLVSVWSIEGDEINVMVHIEVQGAKESEFPERMYVYNYRIFDKHRKPVTSLAILTDDSKTWNPKQFERSQWGCSIDFRFPTVKLKSLGDNMDALLKSDNPFALIAAAHLLTQKSKGAPIERFESKWKLTKLLYQKNFTRKDILNLYRFIDWLMDLPEDLAKNFNTRHINFEEDQKMPYITTAERIGREEGLMEGIKKGRIKWHAEGLAEGRAEGRTEGELIGKIQLLQQILKQPVDEDDLRNKSVADLRIIFTTLEKEWMKIQQ